MFSRAVLLWFTFILALSADVSAATASPDFEGIWTGEISAPNKKTELGLAFTPTEKGLLVSLNFPEMFLYGVNFGPAQISETQFELTPLNLKLTHRGEALVGTFGIAGLPVTLKRGGSFATEPPTPNIPPAPTPLWAASLESPAWASPVIANGVVFIATVDGKMHAMRAGDGSQVWTWSGETPCYGTALITESDVVFVDDRCELIALDRSTGALRWRTRLTRAATTPGSWPSNETFNHRTAVPIIDAKGTLYVGSIDGAIHAIRASTGKVLWQYETGSKIYTALTLYNDQLLAACFDGNLVVLNLRTRKESGRIRLGGPLVSTPVMVGPQRAIVGARDYMLYGLDLRQNAVLWRDSYWFSWVESTPTVQDGIIYVGGSDYRRVSAIDPVDGRTVWATDVLGLSWGSPVVVNDTVFAGTAGQTVSETVIQHSGGLVALDRATGRIKWRYLAPVSEGADFHGFMGSLVSDGSLIIGTTAAGMMLAFPSR